MLNTATTWVCGCVCAHRILQQEKRNVLLRQLEEATRITTYLHSQLKRCVVHVHMHVCWLLCHCCWALWSGCGCFKVPHTYKVGRERLLRHAKKKTLHCKHCNNFSHYYDLTWCWCDRIKHSSLPSGSGWWSILLARDVSSSRLSNLPRTCI